MKKTNTEIKRMISADIDAALDYLETLLANDNDAFNMLIVIRGDLKQTEQLKLIGDDAQYRMNVNRINLSLLRIIDDLPDSSVKNSENTGSNTPDDAVFQQEKRLQVFTVLKELWDLNIYETEARAEAPDNQALFSNLNSKRQIIVNNAIWLLEVYHLTVSTAEYMNIAFALNSVYDTVKAEKYYKKAIEIIDEYTDSFAAKVSAIRGYANFLYQMNRPEEGAKQYESAVIEGKNDVAYFTNGYTYQQIFNAEAGAKNYEKALAAYKKAKESYEKISYGSKSKNNLNLLENAWIGAHMPATFKQP
jgi:tetratricopeptide (TPR) repeat protein